MDKEELEIALYKEGAIISLLAEMQDNEYNHIEIRGCIKTSNIENRECWGSDGFGFKTIIERPTEVNKIHTYRHILKNIDFKNTFINKGVLCIAYDKNKNMAFSVAHINKFWALNDKDLEGL